MIGAVALVWFGSCSNQSGLTEPANIPVGWPQCSAAQTAAARTAPAGPKVHVPAFTSPAPIIEVEIDTVVMVSAPASYQQIDVPPSLGCYLAEGSSLGPGGLAVRIYFDH